MNHQATVLNQKIRRRASHQAIVLNQKIRRRASHQVIVLNQKIQKVKAPKNHQVIKEKEDNEKYIYCFRNTNWITF